MDCLPEVIGTFSRLYFSFHLLNWPLVLVGVDTLIVHFDVMCTCLISDCFLLYSLFFSLYFAVHLKPMFVF
jgi:hypothetical protein